MANLNDSLQFGNLSAAMQFAASLPSGVGAYIVAEGDVRQREGTIETYAWRTISPGRARPNRFSSEDFRERILRRQQEQFLGTPDRYSVRWSWNS